MKTILIVEDDAQLRKMVRDMLELEKFVCITAENGSVGIDLARKYLPDIIISDIMMPGEDGFALKKALSREPATMLIPFLFLTSRTEREFIRQGMELGADDYLFKPVKVDELLNAVRMQFQKREKLITEYSKTPQGREVKPVNAHEYIMIKDKGTPRFIKVSDIQVISADEKYSKVVLASKEKILVTRTMQAWEKVLPESLFVRIHRAYIVNLSCIEKMEKWFNRSYKLQIRGFSEPVYISKRYYSKLKDIF